MEIHIILCTSYPSGVGASAVPDTNDGDVPDSTCTVAILEINIFSVSSPIRAAQTALCNYIEQRNKQKNKGAEKSAP